MLYTGSYMMEGGFCLLVVSAAMRLCFWCNPVFCTSAAGVLLVDRHTLAAEYCDVWQCTLTQISF